MPEVSLPIHYRHPSRQLLDLLSVTFECCQMNTDGLNRWLTLAANVGVIAGLALVAYEIDQTATSVRLAVSADAVDNFQQAMEVLVQNEELAGLIYKAETTYPELDAFERWRVSKYLDGYFSMSEQDYSVILASSEAKPGFRDDWLENMSLPVYRDYWSRSDNRFTPEFRQFIDQLLAEINESQ